MRAALSAWALASLCALSLLLALWGQLDSSGPRFGSWRMLEGTGKNTCLLEFFRAEPQGLTPLARHELLGHRSAGAMRRSERRVNYPELALAQIHHICQRQAHPELLRVSLRCSQGTGWQEILSQGPCP